MILSANEWREEFDEVARCLSKLVEVLDDQIGSWWEDVDEETINTLEELGLIEVSPT